MSVPLPHTTHWKPETAPIAVIALVHGLGEHIGRYEHVGQFFARHGIAVIASDQQGHGHRPGRRGHAQGGLSALLDDIDALIEHCRTSYPNLPCLLYGHSMGGTLALTEVLHRKADVVGVICTSPWIRLPKPPSALLLLAARVLNAIAPSMTQPNGLDPADLSHDPEVVEAYRNDPFVHNRISARLAVHLSDAAHQLATYIGTLPVPVLLLHGEKDKITDPSGSKAFAAKDPDHIQLMIWPGGKHELHNEPFKQEVLDAILQWLQSVT